MDLDAASARYERKVLESLLRVHSMAHHAPSRNLGFYRLSSDQGFQLLDPQGRVLLELISKGLNATHRTVWHG